MDPPEWLHNLWRNLEVHPAKDVKLVADCPTTVPKQKRYQGRSPVIPNHLADRLCADLGIDGMLLELNTLMDTRYNLKTPSISNLLQVFIDSGADLGTAYGQLRGWWADFRPNKFFPTLESLLNHYRTQEEDKRAKAITGNTITSLVPPRRLWDLHSNRVIPYWAAMDRDKGTPPDWHKDTHAPHIWPVSHSWVQENERQYVSTNINGNQWPVPIPNDISLESVRIELLNLGAEYVWLDVLCLRQVGNEQMEEERLEEWRLDVPTIGRVYRNAFQSTCTVPRLNPHVVIYYSGLGRPFVVGDLESPRHWLNRAWTLQETPGIRSYNRDLPKIDIVGGWTPSSPKRRRAGNRRRQRPQPENERRFFESLDLITTRGDIMGILGSMRPRCSVNPVDKIAGLSYLLGTHQLPVYLPNEDPEHAWQRLLDLISVEERGVLLFMYPCTGNGQRACVPSWDQVLNGAEFPCNDSSLGPWARVSLGKDGLFFMRGAYLKGVRLSGFGSPDASGGVRTGNFSVRRGETQTFDAFTPEWHQDTISDGVDYVLISSRNFQHWIVSTEVPDKEGIVKKVSVLQTTVFGYQSEEEQDRIMNFRNLCQWGLIKFA